MSFKTNWCIDSGCANYVILYLLNFIFQVVMLLKSCSTSLDFSVTWGMEVSFLKICIGRWSLVKEMNSVLVMKFIKPLMSVKAHHTRYNKVFTVHTSYPCSCSIFELWYFRNMSDSSLMPLTRNFTFPHVSALASYRPNSNKELVYANVDASQYPGNILCIDMI